MLQKENRKQLKEKRRINITLPLFVYVKKNHSAKNAKFYANLNGYRNSHYFTLNKAKQEYAKLVKEQVEGCEPIKGMASISAQIYPKTRRVFDTSNIGCIIDKFTLDPLVSNGILLDDNYKYIFTDGYYFGAIDSENPRVEVTIKEYETSN